MAIKLTTLIHHDADQQSYRVGDREFWIPARHLPGPLIGRLMDAWLVVTGKADAVVWPSSEAANPDQPTTEEHHD